MITAGSQLQQYGKVLFENMGLLCFTDLGNVPLNQIDPARAVTTGENLEFDYVIRCGKVCLIGEITGRASPTDVRRKYEKFRQQFNFFTASQSAQKFSVLNIPKDHLSEFSAVSDYRGFFITTKLLIKDLNLETVPGMAIYHKNDWDTLNLD